MDEYSLPYMGEETVENGLRTIFIPDHEQPVVTAAVQLPMGKFNSPAGLEGISEICFNLIKKGPSSIKSGEFVKIIENSGAVLSSDTEEEHSTVSIRCLKTFFSDLFPLFWDVIAGPAFEHKEFDRIKKEMIAGIQAEKSDPESIASHHFMAQMYGNYHPAGRVKTAGSIKRVSLEDVRSFYHDNVSPSNSLLVVSGDISENEYREICLQRVIKWEHPPKSMFTAAGNNMQIDRSNIRIIDKPSLSQTTLIMGMPSINEFHDDKKKLMLANYILGGGNFSSRLLKRIRTEVGHSYNISSNIFTFKNSGVFFIKTSTQDHSLPDVLKGVFDVFRETVEKGVSGEELSKARNFSIGNLAFELEGINNIVEKILWLRFYGRDNSYIENYGSDLRSITIDDVNSAMKRNLCSDKFVITAVGKRSAIQSCFKDYGDVEYRNFRSGIF